MKWDSRTYKLTDPGNRVRISLVIGISGLIASGIGFTVDRQQFFHSWLTAFTFWFTLAAGGLFFTMLHHLTAATWSIVLRRLAERLMVVLPFMIVAFIPIAFGLHDLYHWSHAEAVSSDALLSGKAPFLNPPFFLIRTVIYFAVWFGLARLLINASRKQDSGHTEQLRSRMVKTSAPGMILFAFTITFAAFDWLMSLDAHWYSTIFGVYIFAGAVTGILAFLIVFSLSMRRKDILSDVITSEHYHDLGKLLFAFLVFWGYMAFSQYFLIWYGNIPEETIWFRNRWVGSWKTVTMLIVYGHFVFPFLILITRIAKRKLPVLKILALWMLVMHWVDLYWIIMPSYHKQGAVLSWIDFAAMAAVGGFFMVLFLTGLKSGPLVPVGDPRLEESIRFVNQ